MGNAKKIKVQRISPNDANKIVKTLHYSGKVTQNSQLHFGVFLDGKCGGAMQFGPSINKRGTVKLVDGTQWNEFIELNRLAFADWLPRNSESRALGYAMRWLKKNTAISWVISFADGTQCGDGCIYRASGFHLVGIKKNTTMLRMPNGEVVADKTLNNSATKKAGYWKQRGAYPLPGFQLKYIYFIDPTARGRLTVPILPFSEITRLGARMYKGERSIDGDAPGLQPEEGGSIPTRSLHLKQPAQ